MKSTTGRATHTALDFQASDFVAWLARERPDDYEMWVWQVQSRDAQPDAIEVEHKSDEHRERYEALEAAVRRREREKARAGRRAACDRNGVWQRTSYGTGVRSVPAPREATNGKTVAPRTRQRARGAGRPKAHATRSSVRSGDSGDSESSEPPQVGRRTCALDECDLPARRRHCCDERGDTARKRRQRARDEANPDRIWERKAERLAAAERLDRLIADELPAGCRCPGQGVERDPEGDCICVACGRPLKVPGSSPNGYDATAALMRELPHDNSLPAHKQPKHREAAD